MSPCVKQHWKAHRPLCKPGSTPKDSTEDENALAIASSTEDPLDHRTTGKEHALQMPGPNGEIIRMTSTTMSPAFMKEFRDSVEEELGRS